MDRAVGLADIYYPIHLLQSLAVFDQDRFAIAEGEALLVGDIDPGIVIHCLASHLKEETILLVKCAKKKKLKEIKSQTKIVTYHTFVDVDAHKVSKVVLTDLW